MKYIFEDGIAIEITQSFNRVHMLIQGVEIKMKIRLTPSEVEVLVAALKAELKELK